MKHLLFIYSITLITLNGFSQKEITHIASKANNSCNGDCTLLDISDLNDNPSAIIWATPLSENGVNLNPHPMGVYYFKNRWSIFNLDQRPIPEGSKFKVEYITRPDETHFQYTISNETLQKDGSALIDHPSLNNNPGAQFTYFPSWNPEAQRGTTNRENATFQFNKETGKWVVSNTNQKPLFPGVTYNIVLSSKNSAIVPPVSHALEIKELIVAPTGSSVTGSILAMYMTIWADGIKLPGEGTQVTLQDKTQVYGFEMGSSRLAPGTRTGKTVYDPVTIKIHSGVPATIPFYNAFVKKQGLVFKIEVYSNSSAGKSGLNYTINLSGASIIGFRQLYEELGLHMGGDHIKKYYDELRISFSKIEYIKDGVSVEDVL